MTSRHAFQLAPIAYVTQSFPSLTTTFIYREVSALRDIGLDISTLAIWKPDANKLSEEAKGLVDSTVYVFPISWLPFLATHIYFLFTRPLRYFSTLLFVLTRRGETRRNRLRTFFHFCEAIFLAGEVERRGIRHIHAHFAINAATIALVLSRLLDISFSFTVHNIFFTDRILLKDKVRKARFIVAISEFSKQFLANLVPEENPGKIHVVHCGLSPGDFAPSNSTPANDVPVLLFVAQLAERKGAPILVEACRILAERGVAFRCVIVGDGPQRVLVEQMVEQYGLRGVIELKGTVFQEHLKEYLNRANVFVLPCVTLDNGDMDGIPVALMEAMAMEIPTVSTYVSGIPELIEDGHSGLLVNEKDETALANALQQLLEDEELCTRLGKGGREKVIQEFNSHKNAVQLAILFERYLR